MSKQGNLLLVPTPLCCSGDPNKALPEFLVWSLIKFYWLRRSRTLGSNKDISPESSGTCNHSNNTSSEASGPTARDPGTWLHHQWASPRPRSWSHPPVGKHQPQDPLGQRPIHQTVVLMPALKPSPLPSRPAPPRTPWPDHSTNQQNDTSSRTPCLRTSQKGINNVYDIKKCCFFIRQLFHKNQHGKDRQLNE